MSTFLEICSCNIYDMEITKISLPARRYVAVKHKGAYNKIATAFERLFGTAMPLGIEMQGAPAGFWYDDPKKTPEEELNSAAAFPVALDFEIEHDELFVFDIPASEYWATTFYGPYEGLGAAWGEFDQAIEGKAADDAVCFEEYMNDCSQVKPEEVETRLLVAAD